MWHFLLKIGLIVFCLTTGVALHHTSTFCLLSERKESLAAEGNASIHGLTSLSLEETYRKKPSEPAQGNDSAGEPRSESIPAARVDQSAPRAIPQPHKASSGFPYDRLMILIGVSLPALLYLRNRRKIRTRDDTTYLPASLNDIMEAPLVKSAFSPGKNNQDKQAPPENSSSSDPGGASGDQIVAEQDTMKELTIGEIRRRSQQEGKVDVGHLIYLLESTPSAYIRSRALYLLGKYRIMEALPIILAETGDPQPWIRMAAAAALVRLKSNLVEEKMIGMAENDNPCVRATALLVLSRIGTPRAYEILRKSIWDFEPEVRKAAASAVGRLMVPDALFDIREAMTDFEEGVRKCAIRAFNKIKPVSQQERR